MENTELYALFKELVISNEEAHKKLTSCVNEIKVKVGKIETLCDTAVETHADVETRMRTVEKITDKVEELPGKFDGLVKKVFTLNGIFTVVLVLIGVWIKNFS